MSEATVATRGEVLEAIEREREAWEALLAEVGEDRMLEPGPMGNWSFKDLAAHLNFWHGRALQRLEAAAHGQPEPAPSWPAHMQTDDEINDWIQEGSRQKLLGEVIDESRESFARLAEVVQRLPDDALSDPDYFAWLEGDALGPNLVNGGYSAHLREEHEPALRRWLATQR